MSLHKSFFISPALHERKVLLSDGVEHVIHFRELGGHEFVRFREQQRSDDQEIRAQAVPALLALSVCNPDGSPAMTKDQAMKLKASAMSALMTACMEVNTFEGKKPSPSAEESGSATS